jgi:hypothetical protein
VIQSFIRTQSSSSRRSWTDAVIAVIAAHGNSHVNRVRDRNEREAMVRAWPSTHRPLSLSPLRCRASHGAGRAVPPRPRRPVRVRWWAAASLAITRPAGASDPCLVLLRRARRRVWRASHATVAVSSPWLRCEHGRTSASPRPRASPTGRARNPTESTTATLDLSIYLLYL